MSKYSDRNTYARGVKISAAQGVVDFNYLKGQVDFVILEPINVSGDPAQTFEAAVDKNFAANLKAAALVGLPVVLSIRMVPGWYADKHGNIEMVSVDQDIHIRALRLALKDQPYPWEALMVDCSQWYYDLAQWKSYVNGDIAIESVKPVQAMTYLFSARKILENVQTCISQKNLANNPVYVHASKEIIEKMVFTGGATLYDEIAFGPLRDKIPYLVSEIRPNTYRGEVPWVAIPMPEDDEKVLSWEGKWLFWDILPMGKIYLNPLLYPVTAELFIAHESAPLLKNRWSFVPYTTVPTPPSTSFDFQLALDVWEANTMLEVEPLLAAGVQALIFRLNDINGGHHLDEYFVQNLNKAKQFSAHGIYFVYNPWKSGPDNFAWLIANIPSDYNRRLFVDIEVRHDGTPPADYASPAAYAAEVNKFLDLAAKKYPAVSIYTGAGYIPILSAWPTQIEYWWARYPSVFYQDTYTTWEQLRAAISSYGWSPSPTNANPGVVRLWQITDQVSKLSGFGGRATDINVFKGTKAELLKWMCVPETTPPPPGPGTTPVDLTQVYDKLNMIIAMMITLRDNVGKILDLLTRIFK